MTKTQSYYLKWLLDLRGNLLSCELQCRTSWSATNWDRSKVYTSCETSRLPQGACAPLFIWLGVMTLEHTGLTGRKASDWLRLCHVTRGWCLVILLWYLTWVWLLSRWHCFPSKFRGKPTHVVHGKGGHLVDAWHIVGLGLNCKFIDLLFKCSVMKFIKISYHFDFIVSEIIYSQKDTLT